MYRIPDTIKCGPRKIAITYSPELEKRDDGVVRLTDKLGDLFVDNDMAWLVEREK